MLRATVAAFLLLALLLSVLLIGRGGDVPTGTYRGERALVVNPGTDPVIADQLRRVELNIDAEGRAVLEDGGIPWEGRVARRGGELRMEVLTVNGVNIDRQPADLARTLTFVLRKDSAIQFGNVRMERR